MERAEIPRSSEPRHVDSTPKRTVVASDGFNEVLANRRIELEVDGVRLQNIVAVHYIARYHHDVPRSHFTFDIAHAIAEATLLHDRELLVRVLVHRKYHWIFPTKYTGHPLLAYNKLTRDAIRAAVLRTVHDF